MHNRPADKTRLDFVKLSYKLMVWTPFVLNHSDSDHDSGSDNGNNNNTYNCTRNHNYDENIIMNNNKIY